MVTIVQHGFHSACFVTLASYLCVRHASTVLAVYMMYISVHASTPTSMDLPLCFLLLPLSAFALTPRYLSNQVPFWRHKML